MHSLCTILFQIFFSVCLLKIVKIGWHLSKLRVKTKWEFFGDTVYILIQVMPSLLSALSV